MSTVLERLLPVIEEEATNIRHGCRTGLCSIIGHADISGAEKDSIRRHIAQCPLMHQCVAVYATSALMCKGRTDPSMCAPFVGGDVVSRTLGASGLAWVADKWKEWAIGIVRDAQRELYGY